jgi:hypothetical protein
MDEKEFANNSTACTQANRTSINGKKNGSPRHAKKPRRGGKNYKTHRITWVC